MKVTNLPLLRTVVELSCLSQREIAEQAGVSHGTVGNLLAGRRSGCSGDVYLRLLAVLGESTRMAFEPRLNKAQRAAQVKAVA